MASMALRSARFTFASPSSALGPVSSRASLALGEKRKTVLPPSYVFRPIYALLCSATIAARTASSGDLIRSVSFRASFNGRGPGIGAGRGRMAGQVEDVHHAFPYRLAVECLAHWNRLGEPRGPTVHLLDSPFELVGFNFGHVCRISCAHGGGHATGG